MFFLILNVIMLNNHNFSALHYVTLWFNIRKERKQSLD